MTDKPQGPYTVWTDHGYEGWSWADYATLKEALEQPRYSSGFSSDFVITKPVSYEVVETKS